MLSLSNAFDKNDMIDFRKKINNFLNTNSQIELSSEPKIDGISASLRYENGNLIYGLSRGDGIYGENITENLITIKEIPTKIVNPPKIIEIRGEVYISKSDSRGLKLNLQIQEMQRVDHLDKKIRMKQVKYHLKFFAYGIGEIKPDTFKNQTDLLKKLKQWKFKVNQFCKTVKSIEEIENNHSEIESSKGLQN